MSSSKFVLSYQMLNFGGLAVAALLLLTSPHLLILLIGGLVSAGVFLDSDVSMKLMERFGRKPEDSYLKGAVVWITGASSGIGEELAYRLSTAGAHLVLSARNEKDLEAVAESCRAHKCASCLVVPMDITNYESHAKCLQQVVDQHGKIDVLVNNAGVYQQGFVLDTDFSVMRKVVEVDFMGHVSLSKLTAEHMRQTNTKGLVSFNASVATMSTPHMGIYSASKAALKCFADSVRAEWFEYGIEVQVFRIGPVSTSLAERSLMTKENQVGGEKSVENFSKNYNPMTSKRCAELMAVALANRVPEAWIVHKLMVVVAYMYEYAPHTSRWLFGRRIAANMKKADERLKKD